MRLSDFSKELVISPLREIAAMIELAREDPAMISFGGGAPSFDPPEWLKEEIKVISMNSLPYKYTTAAGIYKVRQTIAKHLKEEKHINAELENVMVQPCGLSSAVASAIFATIGPGDEAILLKPVYPSYPPLIENFARGKIKWVDTLPDTAFDIERFKAAIDKKTNAAVIISPDNPTGRVMSKEDMKAIGDLAVDHDFWIIHDEAYDEFVYSGHKHHSFWELGFGSHTIGIRGMSKFGSAPGLRISFSYSPKEARELMERINGYGYLCPSALAQLAMQRYIEEKKKREEYLDKVRKVYMERSEVMSKSLKELLPDAKFIEPQGAFYILPNLSAYTKGKKDRDIFKRLLDEKKVVIVPGSGFGIDNTKGYFRMTFVSEPDDRIREGIKRIADFFSSSKKS